MPTSQGRSETDACLSWQQDGIGALVSELDVSTVSMYLSSGIPKTWGRRWDRVWEELPWK